MRAIVTGGSGFIGYNLVKRLLEFGWDVVITGKSGEQHPNCYCVGYDFHKIPWTRIGGSVDVLFHQAAISDTTFYDEQKMYEVNVWNSIKLFEDAFNNGCRQIVYASSCATYGDVEPPFREDGPKNPLNVYGKSKLLLDQEAMQWGKANGVNIVGLRYSNVYGPHEDHKGRIACMVTQIGNAMKKGDRPRLFKDGNQKRDFVYIKDVVEYNLGAVSFIGQEVFNAGSGVATSFNDVVAAFNDHFGTDLEPEYVDNPYADKYQNFTLCDMSKTWSRLTSGCRWALKDAIKDYF